METWNVGQGRTLSRKVTLRYPKDYATVSLRSKPITGVYTTETLTMKLWVGDTITPATLSTSAVAWLSATDGTLTVTLDNGDTSGLAVGWYRLEIYVTTASEPYTCFEAMVQVVARAGLATAGATYCTAAQVVDVAPWVGQLISSKPDIQSNMGEWRTSARRWVNRQVMARTRAKLDMFRDDYIVPCLDAVDDDEPDWLDHTWNEGLLTYDEILAAVQAFLDGTYVAATDAGLVDADGQVADITAHYTAYLAGRNQIGKEDKTPYQDYAVGSLVTANMRMAGYNVKIYTDDTDAPYIYLRP